MIKKVVMTVTGMVLAGIVVFASSIDAKAALPCTYDIINDANGNISYYTAMYQQAKADEASLLANFNAVKNNPAHSQLEYEQAAAAYNNAVNASAWWLSMVNNAKAYLTNIKGREAFEDKFAANRAYLADANALKLAKLDADGAANIANGVAQQISDVEKAIAGYTIQVASTPSVQPQIDQLNAQLAILKADYAAKAAVASEKANVFNTYLNTLNYGSYSVGFENYQWNRELQRDNLDWDPKGYY